MTSPNGSAIPGGFAIQARSMCHSSPITLPVSSTPRRDAPRFDRIFCRRTGLSHSIARWIGCTPAISRNQFLFSVASCL